MIAYLHQAQCTVRGSLLNAGWQPEPMRRDSFDGKALFFVKDPDGLPIEIHE